MPTIILVTFVTLLLSSGAPGTVPTIEAARRALGHLSAVDFALVVLTGLALALLLAPFQVGFVRILEGYWPPHGPVGVLAESRRNHHRRRRRELKVLCIEPRPLTRWEQRYPRLIEERQNLAVRRLAELPADDDRVLPTRLGNVLRRHEDLAGDRYGLAALDVIPRFVSRRA